jgi:hypothetical protein
MAQDHILVLRISRFCYAYDLQLFSLASRYGNSGTTPSDLTRHQRKCIWTHLLYRHLQGTIRALRYTAKGHRRICMARRPVFIFSVARFLVSKADSFSASSSIHSRLLYARVATFLLPTQSSVTRRFLFPSTQHHQYVKTFHNCTSAFLHQQIYTIW